MAELEEGDFVLCTVDKIIGTTVFVKIEGNGEGSIVTSEIAPGRIRNLRDYVVPNKKIVCKILRKDPNGNFQLSLRRVIQKEKKEVMEEYSKEKKCISVLKSILGDNSEDIINKISKGNRIFACLQEARENPKELENLVGKENAEKIIKIISLEKKKKSIIKKEILLKTTNPAGLRLIKELLTSKDKDIKIKYISAGRYSIEIESTELKKADQKISEFIKSVEDKSRKLGMEFSLKGK